MKTSKLVSSRIKSKVMFLGVFFLSLNSFTSNAGCLTITGPNCVSGSTTYTIGGFSNRNNISFSFNPSNTGWSITGTSDSHKIVVNPGTGNIILTITSSTPGECPVSLPINTVRPPIPGSVFFYNLIGTSCYFAPTVGAISSAQTYNWSVGGMYSTTTTVPYADNYLLDPRTSYVVSVSATNGCGTSSLSTTTKTTPSAPSGCMGRYAGSEVVASDSKIQREETVKVFPNPASSAFEINIPNSTNLVHIRITNSEGQVLKDFSTSESKIKIQSSDMHAGLYFINLTSDKLNNFNKIQIIK